MLPEGALGFKSKPAQNSAERHKKRPYYFNNKQTHLKHILCAPAHCVQTSLKLFRIVIYTQCLADIDFSSHIYFTPQLCVGLCTFSDFRTKWAGQSIRTLVNQLRASFKCEFYKPTKNRINIETMNLTQHCHRKLRCGALKNAPDKFAMKYKNNPGQTTRVGIFV